MKNFVIIGPPGSGKDTQVEVLKERFGHVSISGGDVSRALAAKEPKIREIVEHGALIDDNLILRGLSEQLDAIEPATGIILNGIPRTMYQAEHISEIMIENHRTIDAVVYLEVSEEEVVKRLTARKVCSSCGKVMAQTTDKCPYCGAPVKTREDDQPAAIINRMQSFLDNTIPLITYFKNKGILVEIDGEKSPEEVTKEIIERLDLCQTKAN
jgi:adenylate kinase